jgi:hypothetical protein
MLALGGGIEIDRKAAGNKFGEAILVLQIAGDARHREEQQK